MNKKNIFPIVIFFGFFGWVFISMQKDTNEIKKYKYETVCYVYKIDGNRSVTNAYVYYFYDNKKYSSSEAIHGDFKRYLNKYFKINISRKNANINRVLLEEEVIDTLEILRAGFTPVVSTTKIE